MRTLVRGVSAGAGYALAVACIETWLMVTRLAQMNLPAMTPPLFGVAIQLFLGAMLGALASPLLRLRWGWLWQLAAVAGLWFAVGRATAVEADFFFLVTVVPPVVGFALALGGAGLARWRRWLPAVAGVAIVLAGFGFSEVRHRIQRADSTDVAGRPPAREGAPDVVIVVLDTVRAANVSAYGYARATTPRFDALARDGALFLDATAPATWSLPSHASLFTGVFPSAHGATSEHHYLSEAYPTIGEILGDAGYETACFTANPWISPALGTARGFDSSDEAWRSGGAGRAIMAPFRLLDFFGFRPEDKGGADVATHFEAWLTSRPSGSRPLFVFLNFLEAHFPYHHLPEDYLTHYTSLPRQELRLLSLRLLAEQFGPSELDRSAAADPARNMYDGGVLYTDHLLGRVVDALHRRGTLDSTILVVLSDHGELLGERGRFGHGHSLYDPDTRVPLLVRFPPTVPSMRVAAPVSTLGVMATILELAEVPAPDGLQVGSLIPALEGRSAGAPILSERFADPEAAEAGADPLASRNTRLRAYRVEDLKFIGTSAGHRSVFDLARDPEEARDVAVAEPAVLARLVEEIAIWEAALGLPAIDAPLSVAGEIPELDAEARERLRELGYVE